MNPDEVRKILESLKSRLLPGAADDLIGWLDREREQTVPARLRVPVWGPLGVDGSPAQASVAGLLAAAHLHARPASAAALALTMWHQATADEGIPAQAARVARAALLFDPSDDLAGHADQATADRLARAWMAHARAFLASDDLAPVRSEVSVPEPFTVRSEAPEPPPWWSIVNIVGKTKNSISFTWDNGDPVDFSAWLDERDQDPPASMFDGVPWLSARLADYLRRELGEHGATLADKWIERERDREAALADQLPIPGFPPPPALPGWIVAVDVPGLGAGWGVSAAALNLALAVWWAEVRPTLEAERPWSAALPYQLHRATVGASGSPLQRLESGVALPSGLSWKPDSATGRGLPVGVLETWLVKGRAVFTVAHWRVLDLVLQRLAQWVDSERNRERRPGELAVTPKIRIPRGKTLAEAVGMSTGGRGGTEVDEAVLMWASLVAELGPIEGRIWMAEEVKQAPGRPGAWILTPGEVLLPSYVHKLPEGERRLVPWPDVLPPVDWIDRSRRAPALEAGLALPMLWREAAGLDHGRSWQDRAGVVLAPHWQEHGRDLDLADALNAWQRHGWVSVDGDLVAPGPKLPTLRRFLDESAEGAKKRAQAGARRHRAKPK